MTVMILRRFRSSIFFFGRSVTFLLVSVCRGCCTTASTASPCLSTRPSTQVHVVLCAVNGIDTCVGMCLEPCIGMCMRRRHVRVSEHAVQAWVCATGMCECPHMPDRHVYVVQACVSAQTRGKGMCMGYKHVRVPKHAVQACVCGAGMCECPSTTRFVLRRFSNSRSSPSSLYSC